MIGQVLWFGAVGGLATLMHASVAVAANRAGLAPMEANFLGFAVAVPVSYFGHARFTFGIVPRHGRHFPRHLAVALLGLGSSSATVWLLHVRLGADFASAVTVASIIVPSASFLALRLWAFRSQMGARGGTASMPGPPRRNGGRTWGSHDE